MSANQTPVRGTKWRNLKTGQTARVMSPEPIEGYVVARYKGAAPWLLHINDWHAKFAAIDAAIRDLKPEVE